MSDYIPSEVYHEILLRIPAESLLRLRSVCKAWLSIIDDPIFARSHQLLSSNNNNNNTLLIGNHKGTPIGLINLDSINFTKSNRQLIDAIPVKPLIRPIAKFTFKRKACNGLILISSDKIRKIWAIWNPFTRTCHQLPPPPDAADILTENYKFFGDRKLSKIPATGLGYDYDADDYKVVRIDRLSCNVHRTLVYSLNLRCWRRIKDCPYNFWSKYWCEDKGDSSFWCDHNGVFLNGAIHWLYCDMVYVLDLGTEDYRHLALPPPLATIERGYDFYVKIDAVGGCLSLTLWDNEARHLSRWVMKDYGADWVKLFTFDVGRCGAGMPLRLVAFLENKNQVLFQQHRDFLWYDFENGDVKRVTIHGLSIAASQNFPVSIFRLNDSDSVVSGNVGSYERKRNKTKKGVSTRLKVCVTDFDPGCCSDSSCDTDQPEPETETFSPRHLDQMVNMIRVSGLPFS